MYRIVFSSFEKERLDGSTSIHLFKVKRFVKECQLKKSNIVGGSLRVTLVVDWWFLPKILGMWWGPTKAICHSVRLYAVIILLGGGGDTWTLFGKFVVVRVLVQKVTSHQSEIIHFLFFK